MEKESLKSDKVRTNIIVEEGSSSNTEKDYESNGGIVEFFDEKKDAEVVDTHEVNDEQIVALLRRLRYDNPEDVTEIPPDIEYVLEKIRTMTPEQAVEIMKKAAVHHKEDPNISAEEIADYVRLSELDPLLLTPQDGDYYDLIAAAGLIYWHSPYEEVRACVDPRDDPNLPVETFRSYTLAVVWVIIGAGFNEFFSHRLLTITITSAMVQMLVFPMGNLWAKFMPCWSFPIWKNKRIHLNLPQPWNHKEQMFVTSVFSIAGTSVYTRWNILTQKKKYNESVSFGYQFFLTVGVQYLGLGFAGSLRRYVVYPTEVLWPTSLQTLALNKALFGRQEEKASSRRFTSQTFFLICATFIFFYQWLPSYLFQALSTFNWMTWISPKNFNLAAVTGSMSGVGFNPIASFDWNVINNYYCLTVPLFSYMNMYVGAIIAALCIVGMFYSNQYHTQYLPFFSQDLYTHKAKTYDVTAILDKDHKVDEKKYQNYSPPYYTAGNIFSYGASIASFPMLYAYFLIGHWKLMYGTCKEMASAIWALRKKETWIHMWKDDAHALDDFDDPHSRMMRNYKEVPDWWYYLVLICGTAVGIGTIEGYHTGTPVWSLFMAIGINAAFLIPLNVLEGMTGNTLGLNVLIEIIMGYALPGNPHALMIIKAFGYNIDGQADGYVQNMKLGHYAKLPPKALFRGQMIMVLIQIFVVLGVANWSMANIKDFCEQHQNAGFTCPDVTTYYNSSVIWGAIGPKRIFEGVYPIMKWCWLIGACVGAGFGLYKLLLPRFYPTWFNPILVITGMINMGPPYNLTYMTPGAIANFFSQFYLRRYKTRIWERYNYVLSAGFTAGLALTSIIIFFAVQYEDTELHWWGNDVMNAGVDYGGPALKNVSSLQKGYFGPDPGHFP